MCDSFSSAFQQLSLSGTVLSMTADRAEGQGHIVDPMSCLQETNGTTVMASYVCMAAAMPGTCNLELN